MIIVTGGIKGGSGKTTIATHLAIMRAQQGFDVLLIDADDQETSFDFSSLRNSSQENLLEYTCIKLSGKAVRSEIIKMKGKYDDIIVDAGGRDTVNQRAALSIADKLLVPFVPRSFDLWTLETVATIVSEIKQINPQLESYTFLNRADARGYDNNEAQEMMKESEYLMNLSVIICNRKAFGNAASEGKAVNEMKTIDKKAVFEINSLYKSIFG
jgi:chromosome partitioning protein|tara:strand:- start:1183 stop:1821 length:639 start_codon:yes stop_codon:yes gene_type:complete